MPPVKPYGWRPDLEQEAVRLLAESPMKPRQLTKILRERFGASRTEVNAVYLQLMASGRVKGSFGGKLKLR